jgi:NADH:ubiquinone oxidoreductase subunit E
MNSQEVLLVCTDFHCTIKGGGETLAQLLTEQESIVQSGIRIQCSTCLGHCAKGPNVQMHAFTPTPVVVNRATTDTITTILELETGAHQNG